MSLLRGASPRGRSFHLSPHHDGARRTPRSKAEGPALEAAAKEVVRRIADASVILSIAKEKAAANKKGRAEPSPYKANWRGTNLLGYHLGKDHDQRKQHQGFNKHQPQQHRQLNAWPCSRITRQRLTSCGGCPALRESACCGGNRHGEAGSNGNPFDVAIACCGGLTRALRERGGGYQQKTDGAQKVEHDFVLHLLLL